MQAKSRDGILLEFRKDGAGPAVILVDGALCSGELGPMANLVPLLAQKLTVYHYDRRGRGKSGDSTEYSPEREIDDLTAIIELAGGSAMLFGMSSGAALAALAVDRGLNVSKLALYEPPFHTREDAKLEHVRKVKVLVDLLREGKRSEAVAYFQVDIVGIPRFIPWILRLTPMWPKLKSVAPTLRYDMEILGDGMLPTDSLKRIQIPTALIGGEKSAAFLREAVEATAAAIPNAQKIILPDQSHDFKASKVAPILLDFFTQSSR